MAYSKTIISKATEKEIRELPLEQRIEAIRNLTPHDYKKSVADKVEAVLKENVPNYKPLNRQQKKQRKILHDLAEQKAAEASAALVDGLNHVQTADLDRAVQTLFHGMVTNPEDITSKDRLHDVLTGTDKEQLHDVFLNVMEELANFPAEEFQAMSPEQQLEMLPRTLPIMGRAMEGENLLRFFQGKDCGITEEESKLFTELYTQANSLFFEFNQKLEIWLNDYYPEIEFENLPRDFEVTDRIDEAFQDEILKGEDVSSSIDVLRTDCTLIQDNTHIDYEKFAQRFILADAPLNKNESILPCDAQGNVISNNHDAPSHLKNGETFYFCRADLIHEKPNIYKTDNITALHDFGDGVVRRISLEHAKALGELEKVPEPNGFTRFFDKINRSFGGKGLDSVNKYHHYLQAIEQIKEECQNDPTVLDSYRAAVKSARKLCKQYKTEKAAASEVEKPAQVENAAVERAAEKPLTREERGKEIALKHMLGGEKHPLTPEDKKWTWDNPDAVRQGFETCKREYISALEVPFTKEQQGHIDKLDSNIEALSAFIDGEVKQNKASELQKSEIGPEKQEQPDAPKKQKDPLIRQ